MERVASFLDCKGRSVEWSVETELLPHAAVDVGKSAQLVRFENVELTLPRRSISKSTLSSMTLQAGSNACGAEYHHEPSLTVRRAATHAMNS